ncbi:hypothetical protein [Sphaerisporangium aureirubrum]|uniref:Uncharacterized protein n=1 Tax=Sphaerisporangium aureirubrum TaxID=1544736 RepID=A0ABW1NYZ7_9ACTN
MTPPGPLHITFHASATDLHGTCWCGRTYTCHDAREMWTWLDDHDHRPAPGDE